MSNEVIEVIGDTVTVEVPALSEEQMDAAFLEVYGMLKDRAGLLDAARITAALMVDALIQQFGSPPVAYIVAQELITRLFERLPPDVVFVVHRPGTGGGS